MEDAVLDEIIRKLMDAKGGRVPKQAQITEGEIRQLCVAAKEVFLSQLNLLELEAPIKICERNMNATGSQNNEGVASPSRQKLKQKPGKNKIRSLCVFATSTRDHPIHLWDTTTGQGIEETEDFDESEDYVDA